jgi:dipeptidyl aminopeptidase/acylaminoacyl peptidase
VTSSLAAGGQDQGLHLLDTESGALAPLLPSASPLLAPDASPDGSRIAFVSRQREHELMEIPLAGDAPRPLLSSTLDQHSVAFSPKRNEFVFVRLREMIVHDADRNDERVLLSKEDFPKAVSGPTFVHPEYSPDGQRVAFTCVGCEPEMSLWVVPVSGGSPARVAGGQEGGLGPSWSPDGQWIAYSGKAGLMKLRVGSDATPTQVIKGCGSPRWSPAGEAILCQPNLRDLRLISAADGRTLRNFENALGDFWAQSVQAWARDGRTIFITRTIGDRVLLERLDASTGRSATIRELPPEYMPSSPMAGAPLSLSADEKRLAVSVFAGDSDIWILDGFQAPRTFWDRLWPLHR